MNALKQRPVRALVVAAASVVVLLFLLIFGLGGVSGVFDNDHPSGAIPTTEPVRPFHDVTLSDQIGKTVAQAQRDLGILDRTTSTALTPPRLVAVPMGTQIEGMPDDQLIVTALCIDAPDPDSPTPYPTYFGVTPAEDFTDDIRRQATRGFELADQLRQQTGCVNTSLLTVSVFDS
ncbi:Uncharacterised protein [Nocardia otitidiscaviarum]|uniref:Uncharacterized protein n=1 Tax=Nocardia otitidiscaviarum TaxID=1823 RepID=A0A378Y7M9_9NOCA|nr:hypothetical protein [Nocardia otitidiscaviarum]SUA72868.1 Uncharacterised protein [Nocardia otitidiscaviarum]